MRQGDVLIDRHCRLRSVIAVRPVKIKSCDFMLAEDAFECRAAIHRFGRVISHIFNRSPSTCPGIGAIGVQP
jgi:hypothetical protein